MEGRVTGLSPRSVSKALLARGGSYPTGPAQVCGAQSDGVWSIVGTGIRD